MDIMVTDREYDKLIKRLEFFDATRNNLLTFSFTSVLAILGVALTLKLDSISVWLCLAPFCLIIPFSARIAYYRLASAHISSFLRQFSKNDMQFEIGTKIVTENCCKLYPQISWLVNHEMVLLGVATGFIFALKYIFITKTHSYYNYFWLIVPVILTAIVYFISNSTYRYEKLVDHFVREWNSYSERDPSN